MVNDDKYIPSFPLSLCRFCGSKPKYVKERQRCGHGEYPLVAWVECDCGIRSKEFIIDGYFGCTDTPDTPVLFWNSRFGKMPF